MAVKRTSSRPARARTGPGAGAGAEGATPLPREAERLRGAGVSRPAGFRIEGG